MTETIVISAHLDDAVLFVLLGPRSDDDRRDRIRWVSAPRNARFLGRGRRRDRLAHPRRRAPPGGSACAGAFRRTVRPPRIARPDATLYADLPYALLTETGGFALPNEVDDGTRTERRLTLEPHLVAEKIESVRCYATQLEQLVDGFGDFLTPSGVGLEVYWEPEP